MADYKDLTKEDKILFLTHLVSLGNRIGCKKGPVGIECLNCLLEVMCATKEKRLKRAETTKKMLYELTHICKIKEI